MQKKCTTSCVEENIQENANEIKRRCNYRSINIFTNLIDSVSHSAISTINVFNGYPVGDSSSFIFSTLQTTYKFFLFF